MDLDLFVDIADSEETFVVGRDERHGKKGFRVCRYIWADKNNHDMGSDWDESYQFYENLNDFFEAVEKQDYSKGKAAF